MRDSSHLISHSSDEGGRGNDDAAALKIYGIFFFKFFFHFYKCAFYQKLTIVRDSFHLIPHSGNEGKKKDG